MDALVGAWPGPELLAVVRVDHEARTLIGTPAKLPDCLADVAEWDEVAELHASWEEDHRKPLVLGDVRLAELLRP